MPSSLIVEIIFLFPHHCHQWRIRREKKNCEKANKSHNSFCDEHFETPFLDSLFQLLYFRINLFPSSSIDDGKGSWSWIVFVVGSHSSTLLKFIKIISDLWVSCVERDFWWEINKKEFVHLAQASITKN